MDKIKGRDWFILALDVLAVNAAYFLALLMRFYVNYEFRPTVSFYLTDFLTFAPFYTLICITTFCLFHLYGGMWQYAGINDMNRIIGASIITAVSHVIGTALFIRRMPITYYVIGAILQFLFLTLIRFGYRIWLVEKKKIKGKNKIGKASMVIGAGEAARRVVHDLEDSEAFRPVCILDSKGGTYGKMMDGIPVYGGIDRLGNAINQYDVRNVFIADPLLQPEIKYEVERICKEKGIDLQDYGYAIYLSGNEDLSDTREVVEDTGKKRVIPFSPPDISESEIGEVVEALRSGWITTGPRTKLLERRLAAFIETGRVEIDTESEADRWKDRVVCLNSATAAEELNFRILGIREGDEVIVPAYTYTATASAAIHCGATVKFIDIQKDGDKSTHMPEMDYEALEAAITEKTKAIVAVDLGGIVANYDRIFDIVERKKNLFTPLESDGTPLGDLSSRIQKGIGTVAVICDAAHALGASRVVKIAGEGKLTTSEKRYVGRIAHFTSFSFHAVKNFTTAEGGASCWRLPITVYENGVTDSEIYKFYQLLSLHGQNKDALAKSKVGAWEYDIIGPWYKCNMTDIMAAIGLRQLDRYPGMLDRRVEMIKKYDAVCDELGLEHLIHHIPGMDSSNHLYLVRIPGADVEKRNKVIEEMAKAGVSTNVHYKPLPTMTAYEKAGIENYPNTYDYYKNLFTLPLHTLLSNDDLEMICNALKAVMKMS